MALLQSITEGKVPKAPLLSWNCWNAWRSTTGSRPTTTVPATIAASRPSAIISWLYTRPMIAAREQRRRRGREGRLEFYRGRADARLARGLLAETANLRAAGRLP